MLVMYFVYYNVLYDTRAGSIVKHYILKKSQEIWIKKTCRNLSTIAKEHEIVSKFYWYFI